MFAEVEEQRWHRRARAGGSPLSGPWCLPAEGRLGLSCGELGKRRRVYMKLMASNGFNVITEILTPVIGYSHRGSAHCMCVHKTILLIAKNPILLSLFLSKPCSLV